MNNLTEQFLTQVKQQVVAMTAYINSTNANANDPARKAIVFRRRKLNKMIPHLEGLLSSLNQFDLTDRIK